MANVTTRQKKRATKSPKGNTPTQWTSWDSDDSDNESLNGASMEEMIKQFFKGMKKINQDVKKVREEQDDIKSTLTTNYNER